MDQRVAFVGFSGFERDTLDAYFRLAARHPGVAATPADAARPPQYQFVSSMEEGQWLLVDADQPGAARQIGDAGRLDDALFIGGRSAPRGTVAWLPRPVDALQVKRALDDLLERRARHTAEDQLLRRARRGLRPSARVRQQSLSHEEVRDFHHSDGCSNSVLAGGDLRLDAVLVVTDSPAERSMLREWLGRLGYSVSVAASDEAALAAARRRSWGFIFLGLGVGGLDPFQTCRRLKQEPHIGEPVVVVLCPRAKPIDRIRATFAGCDACLTEPLQEADLLALLTRHDPTFERVFEPTAPLAL
jgi:CheY-like chemotaxis protein